MNELLFAFRLWMAWVCFLLRWAISDCTLAETGAFSGVFMLLDSPEPGFVPSRKTWQAAVARLACL